MYSYREAMAEDIRDWMKDQDFTGLSVDEIREQMNDELWANDHVTGNGSGSYTFDANTARDYILEDPDAEDYIRDVISEFCLEAQTIADHFMDWEYWDVSIRCYLLGQVIDEVLDDYED